MRAPENNGAATQRNAGNGPKCERLGGVLIHENNVTHMDWQLLGDVAARRTIWLARRYRLAPAMAAVVASLHFQEGR